MFYKLEFNFSATIIR